MNVSNTHHLTHTNICIKRGDKNKNKNKFYGFFRIFTFSNQNENKSILSRMGSELVYR